MDHQQRPNFQGPAQSHGHRFRQDAPFTHRHNTPAQQKWRGTHQPEPWRKNSQFPPPQSDAQNQFRPRFPGAAPSRHARLPNVAEQNFQFHGSGQRNHNMASGQEWQSSSENLLNKNLKNYSEQGNRFEGFGEHAQNNTFQQKPSDGFQNQNVQTQNTQQSQFQHPPCPQQAQGQTFWPPPGDPNSHDNASLTGPRAPPHNPLLHGSNFPGQPTKNTQIGTNYNQFSNCGAHSATARETFSSYPGQQRPEFPAPVNNLNPQMPFFHPGNFVHRNFVPNLEDFSAALSIPENEKCEPVPQRDGDDVQFERDQQWLKTWLRLRAKKGDRRPEKKPREQSVVKMPDVQNLLRRSWTLLKELKNLENSLTDGLEGDDASWQEKYHKSLEVKEELGAIQSRLDEDTVKSLQNKLERRRKKRAWQKKRHSDIAVEKEEALKRRQELHDEIDTKLGAKRQKILDAQKEKEMKKNADKILSEVRKKLLDANKSLDLLKSLKKLRQIRKDSAVRKGLFTPLECDKNFESGVDDLIKMMERQKTTYENEEKTLQVILETEKQENIEKEQEQLKNRREQKVRKKQNRNLELLFGKEEVPSEIDLIRPFYNYYMQAEQSVESLLHIRREWDSFLVPDHVLGGSSVPAGWLVPSEPSNDEWASALKTKS